MGILPGPGQTSFHETGARAGPRAEDGARRGAGEAGEPSGPEEGRSPAAGTLQRGAGAARARAPGTRLTGE